MTRLLPGLVLFLFLFLFLVPASQRTTAEAYPGTKRVRLLNYPHCIQLENASTRVVLGHHHGGRVLVYEFNGKNALYLDPEERRWEPGGDNRSVPVSAGRFDIGPEKIIPRRDALWRGTWQAEITGARKARLTSIEDPATGTQLVREFELAQTGSRLRCTQIIRNISDQPTQWCHWSRTFAEGQGICIIPLSPTSRFPGHYVMYEPGNLINISPQDPNIRIRQGYLEILGAPQYPKLGMDAQVGWFAYQMKNDLVFLKKYRTEPDRVYNEVAGLTISIWYPDRPMCELEPIGPRESLEPGDAASFTETWWLAENAFPRAGEDLDLDAIASIARKVR